MNDLEGCTRQPEPLSAVERRRRLCETMRDRHFGPIERTRTHAGIDCLCALIAAYEREARAEVERLHKVLEVTRKLLVWRGQGEAEAENATLRAALEEARKVLKKSKLYVQRQTVHAATANARQDACFVMAEVDGAVTRLTALTAKEGK
jgi:hypothetical protein